MKKCPVARGQWPAWIFRPDLLSQKGRDWDRSRKYMKIKLLAVKYAALPAGFKVFHHRGARRTTGKIKIPSFSFALVLLPFAGQEPRREGRAGGYSYSFGGALHRGLDVGFALSDGVRFWIGIVSV